MRKSSSISRRGPTLLKSTPERRGIDPSDLFAKRERLKIDWECGTAHYTSNDFFMAGSNVGIRGLIKLRTKRRLAHPGLNLDVLKPILDRWDPAKVVFDVLLANGSNRNCLANAIRQRRSEDCLAQENAFAVMSKRSMADVGNVRLALIEPIMDG